MGSKRNRTGHSWVSDAGSMLPLMGKDIQHCNHCLLWYFYYCLLDFVHAFFLRSVLCYLTALESHEPFREINKWLPDHLYLGIIQGKEEKETLVFLVIFYLWIPKFLRILHSFILSLEIRPCHETWIILNCFIWLINTWR